VLPEDENGAETARLRDSSEPQRQTVTRSDGATASEKNLKKLCDRSFLSLWSYPGVFRDQGRNGGKGDGKEVCDLLVIFENHVIIFSDKHIQFDDSGNTEVGWGRWYRKAVLKSAQQVWGAERWIRQFPDRLFLDRQCSMPLPVTLPDPAHAVFHRIVVAHGASRACHDRMGGSGSLMLDKHVVGNEHLAHPFTLGRIDADEGYVHVFDDTSLNVLMTYLDTISDFVGYLTKKEKLLESGIHVLAAGEEELLAEYVSKLNDGHEHDFVFPGDTDGILLEEGGWAKFLASEERRAQAAANEISYSWDQLIEKFLYHLMSGTQYEASHAEIREQEKSFRWLARENRTRRRMLARAIHVLLEKTPPDYRASRVVQPSRPGDPYYLFLLLPRYPTIEAKEYRRVRSGLLREYCMVVRLHYPDAQHVIGIATEPLDGDENRSEDFIHLDATKWDAECDRQARSSKRDLGIFTNVKVFAGREDEYPVDEKETRRIPVSRNSPCFCGSGKRFKKCHGLGMFSKKKGKIFKKAKS
jgi:hypothetical protein